MILGAHPGSASWERRHPWLLPGFLVLREKTK